MLASASLPAQHMLAPANAFFVLDDIIQDVSSLLPFCNNRIALGSESLVCFA